MFFFLNICFVGLSSLIVLSLSAILPQQAPPEERKFESEEFLQKGSFGYVFLVKDPSTETRYALKRVSREFLSRSHAEEHMLSEIATHHSVPFHPNIVRFEKWYSDEHNYYILTEFCSGGDLFEKLLKLGTGLGESEANDYAWKIAKGIEHLHNAKIVHRDLKTENVFIDEQGTPKIGDFGFAKKLEQGESFTEPVGTIGFRAPELSCEKPQYSFPADIWSFGILVFDMFFVRYPIFVNGAIQFPRDIKVSKQVKEFIRSLLVQDPNERPDIHQVLEHSWFEEMNLKNTIDAITDEDHLRTCCTLS